jgi:hypothetical protein
VLAIVGLPVNREARAELSSLTFLFFIHHHTTYHHNWQWCSTRYSQDIVLGKTEATPMFIPFSPYPFCFFRNWWVCREEGCCLIIRCAFSARKVFVLVAPSDGLQRFFSASHLIKYFFFALLHLQCLSLSHWQSLDKCYIVRYSQEYWTIFSITFLTEQ